MISIQMLNVLRVSEFILELGNSNNTVSPQGPFGGFSVSF